MAPRLVYPASPALRCQSWPSRAAQMAAASVSLRKACWAGFRSAGGSSAEVLGMPRGQKDPEDGSLRTRCGDEFLPPFDSLWHDQLGEANHCGSPNADALLPSGAYRARHRRHPWNCRVSFDDKRFRYAELRAADATNSSAKPVLLSRRGKITPGSSVDSRCECCGFSAGLVCITLRHRCLRCRVSRNRWCCCRWQGRSYPSLGPDVVLRCACLP